MVGLWFWRNKALADRSANSFLSAEDFTIRNRAAEGKMSFCDADRFECRLPL
jgi:hypothetical protein